MEKTVYLSQYQAALDMLDEVVQRCPADLWDDPISTNRFWHLAYHAAFYTHLYIQPGIEDFAVWSKHRAKAEQLGNFSQFAYTPAEILEYLDFCRGQVRTVIPKLDLDGPSGFDWLTFSKREALIYNLRHLQQHIGELAERLGMRGIDVPWTAAHPE
jgi:hypothetical protein